MNSNNPALWNNTRHTTTRMPTAHRAPHKHSLRGWFQGGRCRTLCDGGWDTMTTPSCGHPSDGGELIPQRDEGQVPLYGGVARSAGVVYSLLVTRYSYVCRSGALRPVRILVFVQTALSLVFTYSDSSRAKRGDPVNKKALRAFRPQTYCPGLPQSYDNVFNVDRTPSQ